MREVEVDLGRTEDMIGDIMISSSIKSYYFFEWNWDHQTFSQNYQNNNIQSFFLIPLLVPILPWEVLSKMG